MSESKEQNGRGSELTDGSTPNAPGEDARKPYEAPRIVKRRSVAHATLFTATGPTAMGVTMMG